MLSDKSKLSVAANIFYDSLDTFNKLSAERIEDTLLGIENWEDFIEDVQMSFDFVLDKCKFVYESFPVLQNEPQYVEVYERLNTWTPMEIFQLYGQPKAMPNWFFFKEFCFQTKTEAARCNQLTLDILNELLEEEKASPNDAKPVLAAVFSL